MVVVKPGEALIATAMAVDARLVVRSMGVFFFGGVSFSLLNDDGNVCGSWSGVGGVGHRLCPS
jgi:hypothetical protein